jgi:hypothetical protein
MSHELLLSRRREEFTTEDTEERRVHGELGAKRFVEILRFAQDDSSLFFV